jgi:dTDP-4-dehydrorhamnose 3,5-epimerase
MQVEQLCTANGQPMAGPLLITPQVFGDERGFFLESWNQRRFDEAIGAPTTFCQDNHSRSSRGVLRGLHYQLEPEPQGKLVRRTAGAIFDVAVDLRRSSASFGQWVATTLSAENQQQLWVPGALPMAFSPSATALRCSTKPAASGAKPASAPCAGMIRSWRSSGRSIA